MTESKNSSLGQKDLDFMVRGGDLISLSFAMGLLRERQEVLFYNESPAEGRLQNVHNWGEFEIRHLELLGERLDSKVLKSIREYCRPIELHYRVGEKRIVCRENPWKNFVNLYRKFPTWFDIGRTPQSDPRKFLSPSFEQKFNEEFQRGLNRVAENCFRYRQLENLTVSLFETHMPEFFVKMTNTLCHLFRQESQEGLDLEPMSLEERQFLAGLRFFFQHHLDLQWGKVEVYHFLLSLLAPRYQLNEKNLMEKLQKEFCSFGGFWGDPEIFNAPPFYDGGYNLQTQNQKYRSNFCFSFINDSTFKTEKENASILNFSNEKPLYLVQLQAKVSTEECFPSHQNSFQEGQWLLHVEPEHLGGDLGLWLFQPTNDGKELDVFTWVRHRECLDAQYFSNRAIKILKQMGLFKHDSIPTQLDFLKTGAIGHQHLFRNRALNFELHLPKRMAMIQADSPHPKRQKDGIYLGKRRGSMMGSFGSLLEIKDVSYWAEKKY